jgi:hypothetical protein
MQDMNEIAPPKEVKVSNHKIYDHVEVSSYNIKQVPESLHFVREVHS